MGHHYFPVSFKVAFLFLLWAGLGGKSAKAEDKGKLPDIVIQAEEKQIIQRTKPPMGLQVKEAAPVESLIQTEDEVRLKIPTEVAKSMQFVTRTWNSQHMALPSSNYILLAWKGEPVHIFHPSTELSKTIPLVGASARSQLT